MVFPGTGPLIDITRHYIAFTRKAYFTNPTGFISVEKTAVAQATTVFLVRVFITDLTRMRDRGTKSTHVLNGSVFNDISPERYDIRLKPYDIFAEQI